MYWIYSSWKVRSNVDWLGSQANIPQCIRYLAGCKYLDLPGRWETYSAYQEYYVSLRRYGGATMGNKGCYFRTSLPSEEYLTNWKAGVYKVKTDAPFVLCQLLWTSEPCVKKWMHNKKSHTWNGQKWCGSDLHAGSAAPSTSWARAISLWADGVMSAPCLNN